MIPEKRLPKRIISESIEAIERVKPLSLVYCSDESVPALDKLVEQGCKVSRAQSLEDLEKLPRFELGLVFDYLEQRTSEDGIQFLCRLRNLKCDKLWVAVATSDDWNLNMMISLGFKREHCLVERGNEICTYGYDIATYNHERKWNNPRYWANPENWGKYRW